MAYKVEYRGGIPELRKAGLTVVETFPDYLLVSGAGFSFKSYKIMFASITDISFVPEGAKKKNYVLNIEYTANGFSSCAVLTGKEASALHGSLQKWRQKYSALHPTQVVASSEDSSCTSSNDTAAEIERFHSLLEKGIITEEEFAAKKSQLLGI